MKGLNLSSILIMKENYAKNLVKGLYFLNLWKICVVAIFITKIFLAEIDDQLPESKSHSSEGPLNDS